MKYIGYILVFLLFAESCAVKPQEIVFFSGKLVKKGVCGQSVIQILGESAEGLIYAQNWTDTLSGKKYDRVFTVANYCDFPSSIKEGDWFNFTLSSVSNTNCVQCDAYTATPQEKNNILPAGVMNITMRSSK